MTSSSNKLIQQNAPILLETLNAKNELAVALVHPLQ